MNKSSLEALIKRINEMGNKSISALMSPISNTIFLDVNDSNEILLKKIEKSKKTFYPVCDGNSENVLGIIHIKDLLIDSLKNTKIDLREGLHEPVYFNEDMSIHKVYDIFFQTNVGAAFIINKLNNIIGFITLRDITKSLLGSLHTDDDLFEPFYTKKTDDT